MENGHRGQNAADGNDGDHHTGEDGGGVEDAVLLAEEVDHRLQQPQEQQRPDILSSQMAVSQAGGQQHAHQREGQEKTVAQQQDHRRRVQRCPGGQKAQPPEKVTYRGRGDCLVFRCSVHTVPLFARPVPGFSPPRGLIVISYSREIGNAPFRPFVGKQWHFAAPQGIMGLFFFKSEVVYGDRRSALWRGAWPR